MICVRTIVQNSVVFTMLAASSMSSHATTETSDAPVQEAKQVVDVLAADNMAGRGNGSPELVKARELIIGWMKEEGVKPGLKGEWLQEFSGPNQEALANVVGVIAGTGKEWVVVGAHYDGLGTGHPGADDNASGIAALLQIASRVAKEKELARSVYVVAFAGEEIGLLGSRAFAAAPPHPIEDLAAMINLDTVGRMEKDHLIVFGSGTAQEFPDILRGVNYAFKFDLALNSSGEGASDHTAFFEKGVPVLHLFSGANEDYHRATDVPSKVNAAGIVRIADFSSELAVHLAVAETPLTFVPAGAEKLANKTPVASGPRKVSLGTIPDFSKESGGILLSGVMPKSAAEEAGLQAKDLLVEIDGMKLDTIEDFQAALAAKAPGDRIKIRYVREGETKETAAVLRERK
jgi:hypothetical protein